jgi:hypothetical protein
MMAVVFALKSRTVGRVLIEFDTYIMVPAVPDLKKKDYGDRTRGLHKTGIESTDFTETFPSLKPRKISFNFLLSKNKKCHSLNLLLLIEVSIFPLAPQL